MGTCDISASYFQGKARNIAFSWPSPSFPSKFLLLSPARLTPERRRLEVAQVWDAEEEQVKRSVFPPPVEDLGGRTVRVTGFQVEIHRT